LLISKLNTEDFDRLSKLENIDAANTSARAYMYELLICLLTER